MTRNPALPINPYEGCVKVPAVTLSFWIIKITATTVGETAAGYLAVNVGLGRGATRTVMAAALVAALALQLRKPRHTPWAYWLTVVLMSVAGTQIADLLSDGLGVSLYLGTPLLALVLRLIFFAWRRVEGTLSIHTIVSRRRELFYWAAIGCTFALGTAASDLASEALAPGFAWGVIGFGALVAITYAACRLGCPAVLAFWIAYVLTQPLGASLGDLIAQPHADGGMGMGTAWTGALSLCVIMALVALEQIEGEKRKPVTLTAR